jgi:kynureninase
MHLDADHARQLDAADPLKDFRGRFRLPIGHDGLPLVYLCGHSLGAQPAAADECIAEVMDDWHRLAVEGHFEARHPWIQYHERLAGGIARLVGAQPHEVIAMNTLTVNLHLMLASFYRPHGERRALLMEQGAFPSDRHAAESQVRFHGLDPATDLIEVAPRPGEHLLRTEDLLATIEREGPRLAAILLPGVQYLTGQVLDLHAIAAAGRRVGSTVGFDLAHAIGNVQIDLHGSGADFAVWCHYKYVNGGPGAIGGAFVHERHAHDRSLPRLAGWWGHEPQTRFAMAPEFVPSPGADGWQLSNPPILSMAPLVASLALFDEAGMPALRAKSIALTGYLERLLAARVGPAVTLLTPADPAVRGAALSLRLELPRAAARAVFDGLRRRGMLPDWREPGVIRVAPVPLYNRFEDAWAFVEALRAELAQARP